MTTNSTPLSVYIPGFVLVNNSLNSNEKILYSFFISLSQAECEIYPKDDLLCSLVNIKARQLREIFEHMEELLLIRRYYKGSRRYVEVLELDIQAY